MVPRSDAKVMLTLHLLDGTCFKRVCVCVRECVFCPSHSGHEGGHLSIEAGVLVGVADIDEPIRVGGPLHAVFEARGARGKDKEDILHRSSSSKL